MQGKRPHFGVYRSHCSDSWQRVALTRPEWSRRESCARPQFETRSSDAPRVEAPSILDVTGRAVQARPLR